MLSTLVSEYKALMISPLREKSPAQLKKWRQIRNQAVTELTEALGEDLPPEFQKDLVRTEFFEYLDFAFQFAPAPAITRGK